MQLLNSYLNSYNCLVTTREQTRAGFIEAALAKNKKAEPYILEAKNLKVLASKAKNPMGLLRIKEIQNGLLTASGLSDKATNYFNDEDKKEAILALIKNFLQPAGKGFVEELVYRFLLIKGDSLGGSMRNYVGTIAEIKLKKMILSALNFLNIPYQILLKSDKSANRWKTFSYNDSIELAENICAIYWYKRNDRLLFFNANVPLVNKNVDLCLYEGNTEAFDSGRIVSQTEKAVMLGELKGGVDPAGADEHWKTANSALGRIRTAFKNNIQTSFVAAAIENNMAKEIYQQLLAGTLTNAANMTDENQLTSFCQWLINI